VSAGPLLTELAPAPSSSVEQVLSEVREALFEVIGEEYLLEVPITLDTAFDSDLQLESVEFVAISEQLQLRYPAVDFVEWVSNMELEELMHLRVGRLVEFIVQCHS